MTSPADNRTHALYRFYDAAGALLYVGITLNPGQRWPAHRDDKPWWTQVANITLETHPDRATALAAERAAIIADAPRHNVVHNRATTRAIEQPLTEEDGLMLAIVGAPSDTGPWGIDAIHMPDDCHDICVKNGTYAIYFPHFWVRGQAHYQCDQGHAWTCWWGHDKTGAAPRWRGRPADTLRGEAVRDRATPATTR